MVNNVPPMNKVLPTALAESIAAPRFKFETVLDRRPGQATDPKTQYVLAELARLLAPADVLEIGTFFADTTRIVAAAIDQAASGHVTTIDPFGAHRVPEIIARWPENLRRRVTFRPDNSMSFFLYLDEELHVKRGREAPFNLVFVDGHHAFDYAFFDLMRSSLFLRPGGVFVVDNTEQAGPDAAIRLFLERHTHWQLFRAAGYENNQCSSLAFHPDTNAAIIFAPDGVEIGALPYHVDLFDLPNREIRELRIQVGRCAPGRLRVVTIFYSRPADYHNTGQGEQVRHAIAEQNVGDDDRIIIKYDPPLALSPRQGDRVALRAELSFIANSNKNLLLQVPPVTLSALE